MDKLTILQLSTKRYQKLPAWAMIPVACMMVFLCMTIGSFVAGMFFAIILLVWHLMRYGTMEGIFQSMMLINNIHIQLLSFIFVAGLLFIWVKFYEERPISNLGFTRKGWSRQLLNGWLIGTGLLLLVCGITYMLGGISLKSLHLDTKTILFVLSTIPFWFIQSGTEELLTRSWLLPIVNKRSNLAVAVAVSSSLFGILHLGNSHVTLVSIINVILFGLLMSLYLLLTDNIWGIAGIHASWNFTQGNIVGVAVSGETTGDSLIRLTSNKQVPDWLSGGYFGLEGSIVTSVILALVIGYLYYRIQQKTVTEAP